MAISVFMSSVAPPHRPLGNIREWHVLRIPEFDWQLIPLISCSKFNDSSGRIEILFEFCKIVIERKLPSLEMDGGSKMVQGAKYIKWFAIASRLYYPPTHFHSSSPQATAHSPTLVECGCKSTS